MTHDIVPIKTFVAFYLDNSYYHGQKSCPTAAEQFAAAGYHGVKLSTQDWIAMHKWLQDNYHDRYTWTGNTFWFDDEQIAADAALSWA